MTGKELLKNNSENHIFNIAIIQKLHFVDSRLLLVFQLAESLRLNDIIAKAKDL